MQNTKRALAALLTAGAILLTGCGSGNARQINRHRIVCSVFPEYDWTRQILGSHADDFELCYLLFPE